MFQHFRERKSPQKEIDENLTSKTLFRVLWIVRLRGRQVEDKDKVVDCIGDGDDTNQLLVMYSVFFNLLETQHLAKQCVCYQYKCLWDAKVINPLGPLAPRQHKLWGVADSAHGKKPEVFESYHKAGQCEQKAQYHRFMIFSFYSLYSKINEGKAWKPVDCGHDRLKDQTPKCH